MVAVLVILTLSFAGAVLALVHDGAQLRRRVERLERRVAIVEIDDATSVTVEPETQPPTGRRPSQLLN